MMSQQRNLQIKWLRVVFLFGPPGFLALWLNEIPLGRWLIPPSTVARTGRWTWETPVSHGSGCLTRGSHVTVVFVTMAWSGASCFG